MSRLDTLEMHKSLTVTSWKSQSDHRHIDTDFPHNPTTFWKVINSAICRNGGNTHLMRLIYQFLASWVINKAKKLSPPRALVFVHAVQVSWFFSVTIIRIIRLIDGTQAKPGGNFRSYLVTLLWPGEPLCLHFPQNLVISSLWLWICLGLSQDVAWVLSPWRCDLGCPNR